MSRNGVVALTFPLAALAAVPLACRHGEPPAPEGAPSVAEPTPELRAPVSATTTGTTIATPPPSAARSVDGRVAAAPVDASGIASDARGHAADTDPGLLPQTRDMPQASGAAFEARAAALWNAIVQDDPERAMPFFFPLAAYQQVKDVANPAADWKHRLVAVFERDIHALHGRLPVGSDQSELMALEVPESRARWVEPGEEYNKIGYFRVFGSKLRYRAGGTEHAFDVKSLISWRGQWYVVHLSAIK